MTFIPSTQSIVDANNSIVASTTPPYAGTATVTTGYNTLMVTITTDVTSDTNGFIIKFSDNGSDYTSTYYETIFAGVTFTKSYVIMKKYYKVTYASATGEPTFSITCRLTPMIDPKAIVANTAYDSNDSFHDAFGKLRVSHPVTLLDLKFHGRGSDGFATNGMMITNKSSGDTGNIVVTYAGATKLMAINTPSNTTTYISQSRKYCTYQPGKSMLISMSGVLDASTNGSAVTTSLGYYDNNEGFFFKYVNSVLSVVVRKGASDTAVAQSAWNLDTMNGSGTSTINLDMTKSQLFVIDFEWQGVGRIRYGFYAFGRIIYCHQITNINALTTTYTNTPNLPVRYEITNTSNAQSGAIRQICATVMSEGGYEPMGHTFSYAATSSVAVAGTEVHLVSIRGSATNYSHELIVPVSLDLLDVTSANAILYRVRLYQAPATPTSTGSWTWTAVNGNSAVEYGTSATFATTGSIVITQGYVYSRSQVNLADLSEIFNSILQISSDVDNVSDTITITAQRVSGSGDSAVFTSLTWEEIS